MRVIAGQARGCTLVAPEGLLTRPTADRIKESLFNIIQAELADISFLDLFAGSGAIGIEALSRGAGKAVFADNSLQSINAIDKNLQKTRLAERAVVLRMDSLQAIDCLSKKGEAFDIIYADPPYAKGFITKILNEIVSKELLRENGLIIVEQGSGEQLPEVAGLEVYREKKYGATAMLFLRRIN